MKQMVLTGISHQTRSNAQARVPECPPPADVSKGEGETQRERPASIHSDRVAALGMVGKGLLQPTLQMLRQKSGLIIVLSVLIFHTASCQAMQIHKPFVEIVNEASSIFIGTVSDISSRPGEKGKMVFTDVTFQDVTRISHQARSNAQARVPECPPPADVSKGEGDTQRERATSIHSDRVGASGMVGKGLLQPKLQMLPQKCGLTPLTDSAQKTTSLTLAFAGGTWDNKTVRVSDVPTFETGQRYMLFVGNRGTTVASPIVGANQGLFHVVTDQATGREHVLTYARRAVLGIDTQGELVTGPPVKRVLNGSPQIHKRPETDLRNHVLPRRAATSPSPDSTVQLSQSRSLKSMKVLALEDFIDRVQAELHPKGESQ